MEAEHSTQLVLQRKFITGLYTIKLRVAKIRSTIDDKI
jgi:hypothetical protein